MQYVDCDRAEKHGSLCLGYVYEEIDEPCEQCSNCIKCESGSYQLGETEKDNQITKAKEILAKLLEEEKNNMYWEMNGSDKSSYYEVRKQAEQFLKESDIFPEITLPEGSAEFVDKTIADAEKTFKGVAE